MDLYPSDTEEALREASEAYLREHFPLAEARRRPSHSWARMAEMGWFGITLAEEAGGIDMGFAAEALVFAELGRHLAPPGAIAATLAARIAAEAGETILAGEIASGAQRVALGLVDGGRLRAIDAEGAALVTIVTDDGGAVHRVPEGWTAADCLDPSTRQAVTPVPAAPPLAAVRGPLPARHQRLAATAYALGCAEAARDMATDYAKTREQFGKAIGSFQAIKHMCADMTVRCSAARAQLLYAALAQQAGRAEAGFEIAAAKRLADTAAVANGRANIQIHGGIGMTDEADPHLPLKRAHLLGFVSPVTARQLLAA